MWKQRQLIVEMNRLLNVILCKQTSTGRSYHDNEFDRRKSSAESRVRCFNRGLLRIGFKYVSVTKTWIFTKFTGMSDVVLVLIFTSMTLTVERDSAVSGY